MAKSTREPRRALQLGATAISVLPPEAATRTRRLAKGIGVTVNGLVVEPDATFGAMEQAVQTLCVAEKGSPFGIGDAQIVAEERFGEAASQIFDVETGLSEKTLALYRWVAERIDPSRRRMDRLGIRHHMVVAKLTPAKQALWLTRAAADEEDHPWTVARLEAELLEREEDAPALLYVLVQVPDGARQNSLMEDLEAQGLKCAAMTRRGKKRAAVPAAEAGAAT